MTDDQYEIDRVLVVVVKQNLPRRMHLRGHTNILKRLLIHVAGFNLSLVLRKVPSWIANRLIRGVTGVRIHDQGCSLKAWRGEVIRGLRLYSDMHRFIVVLSLPLGAAIEELEVHHRPRVAGRSKYGLGRVAKVVADLAMKDMNLRALTMTNLSAQTNVLEFNQKKTIEVPMP
jgi:hypothetical protein